MLPLPPRCCATCAPYDMKPAAAPTTGLTPCSQPPEQSHHLQHHSKGSIRQKKGMRCHCRQHAHVHNSCRQTSPAHAESCSSDAGLQICRAAMHANCRNLVCIALQCTPTTVRTPTTVARLRLRSGRLHSQRQYSRRLPPPLRTAMLTCPCCVAGQANLGCLALSNGSLLTRNQVCG